MPGEGAYDMNPLQHMNEIEKAICNKADLARIPIAGNVELLPLCNMDCKMCFAKMTREQMEAHHPLIPADEWIALGKQLIECGTIFMLFTGGEPFIYPDFKKVYEAYIRMGFIVSINTNGTLINEEIVAYLAANKPRRLNITLYGASDETYGRLCGNPKGFTQVMRAIKLLKEADIDIKFNCSLTPHNIAEQEEIYRISEELDIPIEMGFYMFPPVRENNIGNVAYRLSAQDAAKARFVFEKMKYKEQFHDACVYSLERYEQYKQTKDYEPGYSCRSGNSVFWINYDGTMSACTFTTDFSVDVFARPFHESWQELLDHVGSSYMPKECHECKERLLCGVCAAACQSESGDVGAVPRYYCDLTNEYINLLRKEVNDEIKSEIRN